ncbi:hypothetical protein MFRU_011g02610 [Monilinia fructicola]|nr:hypothetical protein MFRU_011g02610 [Monilinia fructicola]
MNLYQGNAPGNQGFGSEDATNKVMQSTLEKLQQDMKQQSLKLRRQDRQMEQQKKQLEQQSKQIRQLNQNTQRLQREHDEQIQLHDLHAQQFTMHMQSQQLRIQQLFAMHAGGSEMHAYGPPPLPDMLQHRAPPPQDASRHSVALSRRGRNRLQRVERDRSRSPDRSGRRYSYHHRGERSHPLGASRLAALGAVSRESGARRGMGAAVDGGYGNSLGCIPFRLKDNPRPGLEEGEIQEFVKRELEEVEAKRERDR